MRNKNRLHPIPIDAALTRAAARWGVSVKKIRRDITIAGSPERCELRFVVQDDNDCLYVIEGIFDEDQDHKRKILNTLDYLRRRGMRRVQSYLATPDNGYMTACDGRLWQLAHYVEGVSLKRPEYVHDRWRAGVLAQFLIELRIETADVPHFDSSKPFSLVDFILSLATRIKKYEPALFGELKPILGYLENLFFARCLQLPVSFCHGDYHPLNMIWSSTDIRVVIDWEFLGYKPEIYDAANLMGCIGVEDPSSLSGDLIPDFIVHLTRGGIISDQSRRLLYEFVVAMRFAWLSEWLRNDDKEMVELETTYMKLLVDNAEPLKAAWGLD